MGFYLVSAIPNIPLRTESLFEAIGRHPFCLIYDYGSRGVLLGIAHPDHKALIDSISLSIPGLELVESPLEPHHASDLAGFSVYRDPEVEGGRMSDIFDFHKTDRFVGSFFIPSTDAEIAEAKRYIERSLSSIQTKETKTQRPWSPLGTNTSMHMEIFHRSEELTMMRSILESMDAALSTNGLLYKTFIVLDERSSQVETYVRNRFIVLATRRFRSARVGDAIEQLRKMRALPFGVQACAPIVGLGAVRRVNRVLPTPYLTSPKEGILIGTLLKSGIAASSEEVRMLPSVMNLGLIITGLPGSGKTAQTMAIIDGLIKSASVPVFVLSPTEEWNGFGQSHGMDIVRLFGDDKRINFFRCPGTADPKRFYQDLAMVLASAAGAGPYTRPMEKCMLNAFRRGYEKTSEPDPVSLYYGIEESIVFFHGKKTNTGVRYTKHGENIRSGLESLRIILNDPNYSTKDGMRVEDMLRCGAVFDMSCASVPTKPFAYALLLNQLYAIAAGLDTNGDSQLRMLICVEEAQIMFGNEDSPAVQDLKQRIQDFRKKGIGLLLLAHNITDIEQGIRRLCQSKLYMKQAPDLAFLASKDLIFNGVEQDDVISRLKTFDSRVGAFSTVAKIGTERRQQETIILKTAEYVPDAPTTVEPPSQRRIQTIECSILLTRVAKEGRQEKSTLRVTYLGDVIEERELEYGCEAKMNLIHSKEYRFVLLNKRGKIIGETCAVAGPNLKFIQSEDGIVLSQK